MKTLVVILCSVVGLVLAALIGGLLSTQGKVRQYLEMPAYVGPVPEHVRIGNPGKSPAIELSTERGGSPVQPWPRERWH